MIGPHNGRNTRAIFSALLEREIRGRFVGSIGGWVWTLVHPLLLLAIYALIFRIIFRVQFPELDQHAFVSFVAVGLWPWLAFQEGVLRGTQAVQANAGLVKKVAFNHELLVYSSVAATFAIHLAGFAVVLVALALAGQDIVLWGVLAGLPVLAVLFSFTCALALLCGALQVFLRDVEQVLSPLLMVLFYATPVLYPLSLVPAWLGDAMQINPLVHFVETIRGLILYGSLRVQWVTVLTGVGVLAAFLVGRTVFRRLSPHFEDFL